jgi:hypothetical protein
MSNILDEVKIRYVLSILLLFNLILMELQVPKLRREPLGYEFLSEGNAVVNIAPLRLDDYIIKSGHIFGTTYGRVSHIKHDCDLLGNSSITSEYVMVGYKGRPFTSRGNSGAFVLNSYGELVGLLIVGQERLSMAYVTSITEVIRDIQEVTGHEVTFL